MKVKQIKKLIYDSVCLYDVDADNPETLWSGNASDIPNQYDSYEVRVIGALKKKVIDIGIRMP